MDYNWQQPDWPDFRYDLSLVEDLLYQYAGQTGHVSGILKTLPEGIQTEAAIDLMVAEAIKTSEIEGEYLSRQDVVSSIRNNLGLNQPPEPVKDIRALGAGELMAEVRRTFAEPMTEEMLFQWHRTLLKQSTRINVGVWRSQEEPMQVISGTIGKEKVHFEAPPSSRVPDEMGRFIQWFNVTAPGGTREIRKGPVRSAIAHLYFESIHPFEDGNGRIGRAIAEKALSQTLGHPVLLSLSGTIETDRKSYYKALEQAQKSNDITLWVLYFITVIVKSQQQAISLVNFILGKAKFFDRIRQSLNERQTKAIRRMLDAGLDGFEGGMNARKYISLTKASKATATRDLQQLLELGALIQEGGGRSTRYFLNM